MPPSPRKKRAKAKAKEYEWIIKCKVTLENADLYVTASSEEEAIEKAKNNEWDDIQYATHGALVDWELTGKPVLNQ